MHWQYLYLADLGFQPLLPIVWLQAKKQVRLTQQDRGRGKEVRREREGQQRQREQFAQQEEQQEEQQLQQRQQQREQVAPEEEQQEEQLLARQEEDERMAAEEGDKRWLSQLVAGSEVMLVAIDKDGEENAFMTAKVVATPRGGGVFHNQALEDKEYVVFGDSPLLLPHLFKDWPSAFYYTGMDDENRAALMTSMLSGSLCQAILKVPEHALAAGFRPDDLPRLLTDASRVFKKGI